MATHSNILAWEVPWTGEPGGPEFIGSQLDMTEHTHTQLVTVRCKSVDEILSQMFHHSDSLSDKFRAEKFLVLILLLTLCVWLIKFIQSLWGLIYFSVKSKALDVVSRFKYFYPMEYFFKSHVKSAQPLNIQYHVSSQHSVDIIFPKVPSMFFLQLIFTVFCFVLLSFAKTYVTDHLRQNSPVCRIPHGKCLHFN